MDIENFNFILPSELIAQEPINKRDLSKMLHLSSKNTINDCSFSDITDLIPSNAIIILNNTKVIPSRILVNYTTISGNAKSSEMTLHTKLSGTQWIAYIKKPKQIKVDSILTVNNMKIQLKEHMEDGSIKIEFLCNEVEMNQAIDSLGEMPLPPYIKRDKVTKNDKERYQTVYANQAGALAAPTAGLHFTEETLNKLKDKGVKIGFITLHIGAGTFAPVKEDDITKHHMHKESYSISKETANLINEALERKNPIVAIGTTSIRALEGTYKKYNKIIPLDNEDTNIFIYPPYEFKVVNSLITNFHLPKSTLFMLVSAFKGLDIMQQAYKHAINNKYRFFSYGDCCFLER